MTTVPTPIDSEPLSRALDDEFAALSFRRTSSLNDACAHLLTTRGKLLRGRLALAAARQGPRPNAPEVTSVACAIELLHLASLAHDDVIDAGTVRRGKATVGARYGRQAAVVAGAWLYARAVERVSECGGEALDLFAETARRMCAGGMREQRDRYDTRRSVEEYREASNLKTASAFALAARLGAMLAGAADAVVECAALFGREFGLAYQIWDDLIDLLASPDQSGKSPESDLRDGLYTLPVICALAESDELRARLADRDGQGRTHADTTALITRTAGVERAARAADDHFRRALAALDGMPEPAAMNDLLTATRRRHLDLLR